MAAQHYMKSREYELELAALYGYKDDHLGHISDAITECATPYNTYNAALVEEGITGDEE